MYYIYLYLCVGSILSSVALYRRGTIEEIEKEGSTLYDGNDVTAFMCITILVTWAILSILWPIMVGETLYSMVFRKEIL